MSYITYGPSPTSHYRVAGTPADSLFTSPLDRPDGETPPSLRRRVGSASRAALSIAAWTAVALAGGAAAFALRFAVYTVGHSGGLF